MRTVLSSAFTCCVIYALGLLHAMPADAADIMTEARALGQANAAVAHGALSTNEVQAATPGFNPNPPETGLMSSDLTSAANVKQAACTLDPTGTCEGTNQARDNAFLQLTSPGGVINPTDPTVVSARAVSTHPDTVLGSITGTFSGCNAGTETVGTTSSDVQSCYEYMLRKLSNTCNKERQVSVNWLCPPGSSGPYDNGTAYYCKKTVPFNYNQCPTTHPIMAATVQCSTGLPGCTCSDANGDIVPATLVHDTQIVTFGASPKVTEVWTPGCAPYESRVPPGLLLADGDNTDPVSSGTATGAVNKCERVLSVCIDPPAPAAGPIPPTTKIINRLPVTRTCWQFTNTFNCVDLDPKSDCDQPRFGSCTPMVNTCIDWDAFDPTFCTAYKRDFKCTTSTQRPASTIDCTTQSFTDPAGTVWSVGYPTDHADMGSTIAFMEAVREAGVYMTSDMKIFRGYDNRCRKKLFGLVNCCNKGGGAGNLFSTMSTAMSVGSTVGKAAFSSYTYDALFFSDAPNMVISGFEALFGQGYDSILAGALAGDLSVEAFLQSMVPGPWTIAIMLIQFSGILDCEEPEKVLAMKRDAGLCVDIGEYCSKKLKFIKTCIERKHTYCCYVSKLAKAIAQQGKGQLGMNYGSPENPNCEGFTPAQVQQLNFANMDLTEFIDTIGIDQLPCAPGQSCTIPTPVTSPTWP